jgi:hypothetical protein
MLTNVTWDIIYTAWSAISEWHIFSVTTERRKKEAFWKPRHGWEYNIKVNLKKSPTLSLTSALDGGGLSMPRPGRLTPGKTWYLLYRRLGGPQDQSGQVRKISPPPGFDPGTVQPVASRYTDWSYPCPFFICKHTWILLHSVACSDVSKGWCGQNNIRTSLDRLWVITNIFLANPC